MTHSHPWHYVTAIDHSPDGKHVLIGCRCGELLTSRHDFIQHVREANQ